jgi:hypothetical protein
LKQASGPFNIFPLAKILPTFGIMIHVRYKSAISKTSHGLCAILTRKTARFSSIINCAHCHTSNGYASSIRYRMDYEASLDASKIKQGKNNIEVFMEKRVNAENRNDRH